MLCSVFEREKSMYSRTYGSLKSAITKEGPQSANPPIKMSISGAQKSEMAAKKSTVVFNIKRHRLLFA
jgi:hypothetical protein